MRAARRRRPAGRTGGARRSWPARSVAALDRRGPPRSPCWSSAAASTPTPCTPACTVSPFESGREEAGDDHTSRGSGGGARHRPDALLVRAPRQPHRLQRRDAQPRLLPPGLGATAGGAAATADAHRPPGLLARVVRRAARAEAADQHGRPDRRRDAPAAGLAALRGHPAVWRRGPRRRDHRGAGQGRARSGAAGTPSSRPSTRSSAAASAGSSGRGAALPPLVLRPAPAPGSP